MDNTQFTQMMGALDNTCVLVSNVSFQVDLLIGAVFAVVFAAAYRWHL